MAYADSTALGGFSLNTRQYVPRVPIRHIFCIFTSDLFLGQINIGALYGKQWLLVLFILITGTVFRYCSLLHKGEWLAFIYFFGGRCPTLAFFFSMGSIFIASGTSTNERGGGGVSTKGFIWIYCNMSAKNQSIQPPLRTWFLYPEMSRSC